jgi:two-component system, OmpR family, phosphate regulon sensor histidine kinase PhoR
MLSQNPTRVFVALLLILALATIVFQSNAGGWAAAAVVLAGVGTVAIFALFADPQPIQTSVEATPPHIIENAVINAIAEPVLLLVENRVQTANASALALLGAHIVGEDVRLAIRHPAASARLATNAVDGSVELLGVGGREQQVELNVATIAPGKRVVHLIDRAARRAVEQARVDFVANASHELRTPLAAVLGFIETLLDDNAGGDPAVRARFLNVMMKEARRMQRLIDDLISLSRIEAEKHVIPDEIVSLSLLVREVAAELRDQQGDKPNRLLLEVDSDAANVTGERTQLSQVVHNLVGNAIKYGRSSSPVTISVRRDGAMIRLTVADEGDGIAAEHLPRLTERFYRTKSHDGRHRARPCHRQTYCRAPPGQARNCERARSWNDGFGRISGGACYRCHIIDIEVKHNSIESLLRPANLAYCA